MHEKNRNKIDFIFAQVPLWITYSGLPQKLGMSVWCVYKRLLELRYRFSSTSFYYPLEKLCKTTGAIDKNGLKKILNKLKKAGLIRYYTSQGRGMATCFEIIEPINAPLSEEEVYRLNPRLRSQSYKKQLAKEEKKGVNDHLLEEKKGVNDHLLEEKKGVNDHLLEEKKGVNDTPNKKDIYNKDNNNKKDLSHEIVDPSKEVGSDKNQAVNNIVVVLNVETLKKYGIAGGKAEKYLRRYTQDYLLEKIEMLEYKQYCGEEIRSTGGMLKKAIEEDWQPPKGFTTRAQRVEMERKEKEAEETAARETRKKREREEKERELAEAAEEWKKTAHPDLLEEIHARARDEVKKEFPDTEERFLRTPIRLRENKIIAEEYLQGPRKKTNDSEPKAPGQAGDNDSEKEKTLKVKLYLRVEGNNKYVRGRKRVIEDIEQNILSRYDMRKLLKDGGEYELTIPYKNDKDLDETIYEMLGDMEAAAEDRDCFTEADVIDEMSDRNW